MEKKQATQQYVRDFLEKRDEVSWSLTCTVNPVSSGDHSDKATTCP